MSYEIVTHDGKRYTIKQQDEMVVSKLAAKLELVPVTLSSGKVEYFSKGTVARIEQTHKAGENGYKTFDELDISKSEQKETGDGYKKYLEMKKSLLQ